MIRPITHSTFSGMGAVFSPAYDILRKNEGGYVFHPDDPGGETYAGIARRFHPNWAGWTIIDQIKRRDGSGSSLFSNLFKFVGFGIETNEIIPELENLVFLFYKNQWDSSRAGQIDDQQVANNYFDFFILSSKAVEILQRSLNTLGFPVNVDNRIGPKTIEAVNRSNPERLNEVFVKTRKAWHKSQVENNRAPGIFLSNWLSRAQGFSTGLNLNTGIWIGAGILVVGTMIVVKNREKLFKAKVA